MLGVRHGSRAPTTRFTDHAGIFTDAAMSVKIPQPYCRLVFRALKPTFFTDAAWF